MARGVLRDVNTGAVKSRVTSCVALYFGAQGSKSIVPQVGTKQGRHRRGTYELRSICAIPDTRTSVRHCVDFSRVISFDDVL